MIKEIKLKEKLVGIIVDNSDMGDGTHPITPSEWPLQLIALKRNKGHIWAKHTHKAMERVNQTLQEAIVVNKGKVLVTVCDRTGVDIGDFEVSSGQCLFLVDGGYKIEAMEDTSFYEFKNGPHPGLDDKVLL